MKVAELSLTKEQLDWLDNWMELFGAWVYSGRLEKRMSSVIAQYMATVEPSRHPERPMCNDDDGMLISQVVDSVMCIDKKAFGIVLSYYVHLASKRSIAAYYHKCAIPRKMTGRGGDRCRAPSLVTCRREVDQILAASQWLIYQKLHPAINERKRVANVKEIDNKWLTHVSQ
jgi:hypothetical protein